MDNFGFSGFIIYNRSYFLNSFEKLRDSVCDNLCIFNSDFYPDCSKEEACDNCPFISLLNDILKD